MENDSSYIIRKPPSFLCLVKERDTFYYSTTKQKVTILQAVALLISFLLEFMEQTKKIL